MQKRLLLFAGLALGISSAVATADDKDLLKKGAAPANLLIVFGNSQTTEQPIQGSASAWDGDADSPASKLGAAKTVIKQFILDKHASYNIGLSAFSHGSSSSNVAVTSKHWLYSPIAVDFPNETWKEPIGTIERWGPLGEGPCTNLTSPPCTDRSPSFVTLPSGVALPVGPFFGVPTVPAYIYVDGTTDNKGQPKNATKRIQVTLGTIGKYGDAFTNGSLSTYTIGGTHSMEVTKVYQQLVGGSWVTGTLPSGDAATVTIPYVPAATLTKPDLFYTTGVDAGKEIGFLNDDALIPKQNRDLKVGATCAGWEFQANNATIPLIRIPRDYAWGPNCAPPQDSLPCANRLMRPQGKLVSYNQGTGLFTPNDYDNPGYATNDDTQRYVDGCDKTLLGAVDASLNDIGRQALLITQNGNQAPIKNLLQNILDYFTKSSVDGFQNGKRIDDPNKACRTSGVVLIYDNFNGCQNDNCDNLNKAVLTDLKKIGVPIYVIGFGTSVGPCVDTTCAGFCIAQNTGATIGQDGPVGYFPVTDAAGLYQALSDIASLLNQSPQTFATSAVSTSQATGDQMAYFASFAPTINRSVWNGRLNGYKLDTNGNVQLGQFTITDSADANKGATIPVPSNDPSSLIWSAGQNLIQTPGTGATVSAAVLAPGAAISNGSYVDISNDGPATTIPTHFYPGRKIVFSLPQGSTNPATLPIPAADALPENRYDMTFTTGASWWPTLKALLGPQTSPPAVRSPALTDADAGDSLRFIWGDRDAVTGATDAGFKYGGQKLGDIFHSGPLLVGNPSDFALFKANPQGYQTFFDTYRNRRRVLYLGANDGLLHAFEAGVWDRTPSVCPTGHCYDLGTGAELFAFAPRAIMQTYKPLKDAVGAQTKQDEWTVDLSPSAADVFIDTGHSGTPVPANRAWHTVLVGGVREGSPFEGTSGATPKDSRGSYFALDVTQPDELVGGVEATGTLAAPKCLNSPSDSPPGDSSCARAWPTVLWEITDSCGTPCTSGTGDLDVTGSPGFGYPDMGETWSKASMGRVKVCTANCGNTTTPLPVFEDHYVAIFGGGFDRERLNRRGNWLYMVDVETGKALYKVNSSCGVNSGSGGCTPTYFGSVASEPAALDYNGDGYLDVIYVGDLKGQVWRIDLTDLRKLSSPPGGRFNNQLDLAAGSGQPFLFFQAPQPTPPATTPFRPIYFRPEAINLGYNSGGKPALGIAFGTGDRDDILATIDTSSLTYKQRFYYIVDAANSTTTTESTPGLLDIATPTAAAATSVPAPGWFLELINGERVVGDSLTAAGVIHFPTFNPLSTAPSGDACANTSKCTSSGGTSRLYKVLYATGNAYLGAADRGETQLNATFITAETAYLSGTGDASGIYYSGGAKNPTLGVGRKITVKSWKEKSSRP